MNDNLELQTLRSSAQNTQSVLPSPRAAARFLLTTTLVNYANFKTQGEAQILHKEQGKQKLGGHIVSTCTPSSSK
eukprot:2654779-Amphidinium_carterae.1